VRNLISSVTLYLVTEGGKKRLVLQIHGRDI